MVSLNGLSTAHPCFVLLKRHVSSQVVKGGAFLPLLFQNPKGNWQARISASVLALLTQGSSKSY